MPKWGDSVSEHTIEQVVSEALKSGTIGPEGRAFAFHDLALLRSRLSILKQTFPANTLHAIAIKANPLVRLLGNVVESQCGLEVNATIMDKAKNLEDALANTPMYLEKLTEEFTSSL